MKGIVSALGMSADGVLAAGTYSRWIALYDAGGGGGGGNASVFSLGSSNHDDAAEGGGGGITQVLWSACGRYLCVAERASDGIGVWDIRGTGRRLAWLRGRNARTQQRLGVEVVGGGGGERMGAGAGAGVGEAREQVWAGSVDGNVRVWSAGLGMAEGTVDAASWGFRAHEDAVASTTLHASGSVLATCSGQRHPFHQAAADDSSSSSSSSSSPSRSPSPQKSKWNVDNTLKLWAL